MLKVVFNRIKLIKATTYQGLEKEEMIGTMEQFEGGFRKIWFYLKRKIKNKIRDFFKVNLYTIRSETKKERERERETYVNPSTDRGVISDPN